MKLWYQTVSRLTTWGAYGRALRTLLDGARDPETEIELHPITVGMANPSPLDPAVVGEILDNLRIAVDRGFDAFLIDSIVDPGLEEGRKIADIPVLGLCESALRYAAMIGGKFSLIATDEKLLPRIAERVAGYGFSESLVSIRHMAVDRGRQIDRGFDDLDARQRVLDAFREVAMAAARAGADTIITADSALMALLAYAELDETGEGIAIIDGISNLVMLGEMAVKVDRVVGGAFTPDRLEVATELIRSYEVARRHRPIRRILSGMVTTGVAAPPPAAERRRFGV
ncbi:MAG TPA: aspartate/glutamate racemase family protein [Stellaceae bacterium]|nr:aspartate/glutamate racemase family protein [Stellaceae bacterium]